MYHSVAVLDYKGAEIELHYHILSLYDLQFKKHVHRLGGKGLLSLPAEHNFIVACISSATRTTNSTKLSSSVYNAYIRICLYYNVVL